MSFPSTPYLSPFLSLIVSLTVSLSLFLPYLSPLPGGEFCLPITIFPYIIHINGFRGESVISLLGGAAAVTITSDLEVALLVVT